jgi:hypothetical protein
VAERSGTGAFAAKFVFVAQGDVQHAAFAAVHRIKAERRACVLYLLGGGQCADAQLFDPQSAVIVGVEGNARMVVRVEAQHLLGDEFQGKQELGSICQQQFDVSPFEFYDNVGIFEVRMAVIAGFNAEIELEAGPGDDLTEKLLDPRAGIVNRILGIQARFLPSLAIAFFVAAASTGAAVLLKNHCWAMPTILPVSQYNTSPLDAFQKKNRYMRGMNCIIFC